MQKISINDQSKLRPNTSKIQREPIQERNNQKNELNKNKKSRPSTSVLPFSDKKNSTIENDKNNNNSLSLKHLNIESNKNCRFKRPSSNYKDKLFNKYWEPSKDNILSVNKINIQKINKGIVSEGSIKIQEEMNIITNPMIVDYHNKAISTNLFNRNLYKLPIVDWASRKNFNFLTNINGSEVDAKGSIFNSVQESTTEDFSGRLTRPGTGSILSNSKTEINLQLITSKRPETSKIQTKNRLLSAKTPYVSITSKKNRPMTAVNNFKLRPISSKKYEVTPNLICEEFGNMEIEELIEESLSEVREQDKKIIHNQTVKNERPFSSSNHKRYPNVESLLKNYEKLDAKNYSIKLQAADTDLLDIFDRSQRTTASTLSKVGDYDYYTALQRIGSFMDFSQNLQLSDLKKIEKHIANTQNSVSFLLSRHGKDSPHRKRITINNSDNFRDPNSLFHGFMRKEDEVQKYILELGTRGGTYDPIQFLPHFIPLKFLEPSNWPPEFYKRVITSINNYMKYLNSDKIRFSDLIPFDKSLRKKFLGHIEFRLFKNRKNIIEEHLIEIEENFYFTLKNVIMEYILRSPFERKRLNIQLFPKKASPSSVTIAEHGSFNRNLYKGWVENYTTAQTNIINELYLSNITLSALCDWSQSFSNINLFYMGKINKLMNSDYETIHMHDFYNIQFSYLKKTFNFMKDIYYRGVLLITRKNKYLKRKNVIGKWTFKGYVYKGNIEEHIKLALNSSINESQIRETGTYPIDTEQMALLSLKDDFYGMEFTDMLEDFWSNVEYKDLIDIRMTASYFAYATILGGKDKLIDFSRNEYDNLTAEEKVKLNTSVTTHTSIFLRGLVEKSVRELSDFIFSFKFIDDLLITTISTKDKMKDSHNHNPFNINTNDMARSFQEALRLETVNSHQGLSSPLHTNQSNIYQISYDINSEIFYNEKEIQLPNLKAFRIKDNLKPIINIKIKFDHIYNNIRLEYTHEQITDQFLKLIDYSISQFNSLCTTHFLEFKTILPTEYEKIQKEHWNRLNEIFMQVNNNAQNDVQVFADDYFTNMFPNGIVEEIAYKNLIKNYLRVAFTNEDNFVNIKNRIAKNIKIHFFEMEEYIKLFEPLKELINNHLYENVVGFLDTISLVPEYIRYNQFVDRIRIFQKYISSIPNYIRFSMFCLDLRETKGDLMKKLNEIYNILFKSLEDIIMNYYNNIIDRLFKIHRLIDRNLLTPEDIVEMEKTKNLMLAELYNNQKDFEEANIIFNFLLKVDCNLSEILLSKSEETIKRHLRFKKELEEIEKLHRLEKEKIENRFREEKRQVEDRILRFNYDVNSLDRITHITDFNIAVKEIEELENLIVPLKNAIETNLKDEELLFSFKLGGFDDYDKTVSKLCKLSVFWKNSANFYEHKLLFLENFTYDEDDIKNFMSYTDEINNILSHNKLHVKKEEEIVIKLTKVVEEELLYFKQYLDVMYRVAVSESPLESYLKLEVEKLLDSRLDPVWFKYLSYFYNKNK